MRIPTFASLLFSVLALGGCTCGTKSSEEARLLLGRRAVSVKVGDYGKGRMVEGASEREAFAKQAAGKCVKPNTRLACMIVRGDRILELPTYSIDFDEGVTCQVSSSSALVVVKGSELVGVYGPTGHESIDLIPGE